MKNCVRCGKEIDVIAKDPSKVFYCQQCSFEILKIDKEKLFVKKDEEVTFIPDNKFLFIIIPGIYQLQRGKMLKACVYFYASTFFTVAWFVFLSLFLNTNTVSDYDIKPLKFFSFLVIVQYLLVFYLNLKEIKSGTNRS